MLSMLLELGEPVLDLRNQLRLAGAVELRDSGVNVVLVLEALQESLQLVLLGVVQLEVTLCEVEVGKEASTVLLDIGLHLGNEVLNLSNSTL